MLDIVLLVLMVLANQMTSVSNMVDTQEYVDFFAGLKGGDRSRVVMGAIVSPDSGVRYAQPDNPRPSCVSELGEGYAGYRYLEVVNAFPLSATTNICEGDYGVVTDQLAAIFGDGAIWGDD